MNIQKGRRNFIAVLICIAATALIAADIFIAYKAHGERRKVEALSDYSIRHAHDTDKEIVVNMTEGGFVPERTTIHRGDSITWLNNDSTYRWPASDAHPTHTAYPGNYDMQGSYAGSQACTGPQAPKPNAFDPCSPVRHHPQSGWLDELDRLKDDRPPPTLVIKKILRGFPDLLDS